MEIIIGIFYFAIIVLMITSQWKIFAKAGQPGWACLVPIYNIFVLLKIVGKPGWWFVLLLIPIVNFIILILLQVELAKAFGKDGEKWVEETTGIAVGLIFLPIIFLPMLAFGDSQYVKNSTQE